MASFVAKGALFEACDCHEAPLAIDNYDARCSKQSLEVLSAACDSSPPSAVLYALQLILCCRIVLHGDRGDDQRLQLKAGEKAFDVAVCDVLRKPQEADQELTVYGTAYAATVALTQS